MTRSRQRGQSVIEFGIIAILFTLIMFAIVDFGILLNDWLSVSSGARLLARDAAVGRFTCTSIATCPPSTGPELVNETSALVIPGVAADAAFGGVYCCGTSAALRLNVTYYSQCTLPVSSCTPVRIDQLDSRYSSDGQPGGCITPTPPAPPCPHPAAPNGSGPGDIVVVTLTAAGAQVITPLVRPFFQSSTCPQPTTQQCYVGLASSVTMRFEGDTV